MLNHNPRKGVQAVRLRFNLYPILYPKMNIAHKNIMFSMDYIPILAEREGFEPSIRFPAYTLSKRAPSATRPPLRFGAETNTRLPGLQYVSARLVTFCPDLPFSILRGRPVSSEIVPNAGSHHVCRRHTSTLRIQPWHPLRAPFLRPDCGQITAERRRARLPHLPGISGRPLHDPF